MPLYQFHTARLRLRPYTCRDAPLLYRLMADPRVYFWREPTPTFAEAEKELESKLALGDIMMGYWAVFDKARFDALVETAIGVGRSRLCEQESAAFLGQVCIQPLEGTEMAEFGYAFAPEAWGKGYATEASVALLRHIFECIGLDKVAAIVLPDNRASLAVMDRLGFTAVGEGIYGTSQRRHTYFELTRFEFEKHQAAMSLPRS